MTRFLSKEKSAQISVQTKVAELKLLAFVAEHNLALSVLDHLPKLISSVCPDSQIGKNIKLGRRKGTKICTQIMKRENLYILSKQLQKCKFSLIIDECTDVSTSKSLVLVVRFYDAHVEIVSDYFLALIKIEHSSASGIFGAICNFFQENQIPFKNLIGFAADNAATMMGHKSGVKQRLMQVNPDLYTLGCSCHSLDLCSSAACCKLPSSVEELSRDIYAYFSHSSKRVEAFKEYQFFTQTQPHKILRPSQTRWLSLQSVVNRILEQWSALQLFFSNEALSENVSKAKNILAALHNDYFKLYFWFLSYILEIINKINLEFQSEGFKMHVLLSRVTQLYRTILLNFMKPEYLNECQLDKICFHPDNYLPINNVYVGAKCELLVEKKTVSKGEIHNFRISCLSFYIELCNEIKKRFKFDDSVLNFTRNLDPKIVTIFPPESIAPIYNRFKSFFPNIDIEELSTEWRNISTQDYLVKQNDKSVEEFWSIVFNLKNSLGSYMFPNWTIFIQGLLALPHSSASAERQFSNLNLIKTKNRNKLNISTCDALLHVKSLVSSNSCYSFNPSQHLLSLNITKNEESDDEELNDLTF